MIILYVSKVLNHHQFYFVNELAKRFPGQVWYATVEYAERRRRMMHFPEFQADWIFSLESEQQRFQDLFLNADIVLCHDRDQYKLIEKRLERQKLTFYFSERWFKTGYGKLRLLQPRILYLCYLFKKLSKSEQFFFLAQGEFAATDFASLGIFKGKAFNFGYITNVEEHPYKAEVQLPKRKTNILWCGRFLSWKRVDKLVQAFINLSQRQTDIHLTIVGNGPMRKQVEKLVQKCPEQITLYDFLPTDTIRTLMNQADIYVLPSNGCEGWGAVVNEAMAEGCAIIGGDQAGSIKALVKDGENGLLLRKGNVKEISDKLEYLIEKPEVLAQMKEAVRRTAQEWSPQNVCDRFLHLVQQIQLGKSPYIYHTGSFKILEI